MKNMVEESFVPDEGENVLEYSEEALRGYLLGKLPGVYGTAELSFYGKCSQLFRMERLIGNN